MKPITNYRPRHVPCLASNKQVRSRIRNENRRRRWWDPLHSRRWYAYARIKRFQSGRPYLELKGRFRRFYTTPAWGLDKANYPAHVTLPWGAEARVNQLAAQRRYLLSCDLYTRSSTTYEVTGGEPSGVAPHPGERGLVPTQQLALAHFDVK